MGELESDDERQEREAGEPAEAGMADVSATTPRFLGYVGVHRPDGQRVYTDGYDLRSTGGADLHSWLRGRPVKAADVDVRLSDREFWALDMIVSVRAANEGVLRTPYT